LKLQEIIDCYGLLDNGAKTFAELGSAPGSMTKLLCGKGLRGTCVTLGRMNPVQGAEVCTGDVVFADVRASFVARCCAAFPGGVDLALSDMARYLPKEALPAQEEMHLAMFEYAAMSLEGVLRDGGNMVIKIFGAVCESTQRKICDMAKRFEAAYLFKPLSSRPFNSEVYLVCIDRLAAGVCSTVDEEAVKHAAYELAATQVGCLEVLLARLNGEREVTLRKVLSPAVTSCDVGRCVRLEPNCVGGCVLKVGNDVRSVIWATEGHTEGTILRATAEQFVVATSAGEVTLRNGRAWRSYMLKQAHQDGQSPVNKKSPATPCDTVVTPM
jgi:23S rRNA U2552 (ribose-2'-O)-methylase RlmE/FtsJ